jgi:DnaK suppressor protein
MARKDALLRLHKRLIAKRDSLRKKIVDELDSVRTTNSGSSDVGDAAADGASNELETQIAALESRELRQVERAIEMMREGRYGSCENCDGPIPIMRLNALPFTPLCVECQRKIEEFGVDTDAEDADWESAYEFEGRMSDREMTLGDIDIEP